MLYAVNLCLSSIPSSSLDWLPANPGHGTKILDATVAGLPVSLVLITFVTSRCVLLVQSPISGPEGCRPRVPRTVKVIGTSGAYPQSAKRRTTVVQLYTACSLFMYMS